MGSITGALAHLVLLVVPKFLLTIGGFGLIAWGLFAGPNWALVGWGAAAIIGGQIVHAIDYAILDRKLQVISENAVRGIGPIPPKDVRKALLRQATALGGDFDCTFSQLCVEWSRDAATVMRGAW